MDKSPVRREKIPLTDHRGKGRLEERKTLSQPHRNPKRTGQSLRRVVHMDSIGELDSQS